MNPLLRSVMGVVSGVVLCGVVIFALQMLGMLVSPPPEGLDFEDKEQMARYLAGLSVGQLLWVLFGYAAGAVAGGYVAARVAGHRPLVHAALVAAVFLVASAFNLYSLPHPAWFAVVNLGLFVPAAALAAFLGRPKDSPLDRGPSVG